jgi:ribosomal protein S18 acetylase RimI-like enzyme
MILKLELNNIEHLNQIIQLQKKSYFVEAKLLNYSDIPNLKDTPDTLAQCNEVFYGYFIHSLLVGIVSYKIDNQVLDIHRVAVDPDYFRQGIASSLFLFIESVNPTVKESIVQTGKDNFPAIALYKKNGFIELEDIVVDEKLVITKLIKYC